MSDKNDVVILNLDRPRELRYGHKAIKKLGALLGTDIDAALQMDGLDLEQLEKILYCGLLSDAKEHGETLTLEQMEDLLDKGNFGENLAKMQEAFNAAFGNFGDSGKNSQGIAAEQKENGAGKSL